MRFILALLIACIAVPIAAQTRITAITEGSGTITTGGTSQQVFPPTQGRLYLMCQNPITATETLFVNFGIAASTAGGSIELAPGGVVQFLSSAVPIQSVNVTAATTAHRFVCKAGS